MEEAVYITKLSQLEYVNPKFTRLYFGQEFCETLLPAPEELQQVLDFVQRKKLAFTWVTPYLTQAGLKCLANLDKLVADTLPQAEVIINDWGHLRQLKLAGLNLKPVLGRLLTKQKRGPRTLKLLPHFTPQALEHFQSIPAHLPHYTHWLKEQGFIRLELDNLLQGINSSGAQLEASLYYPFAYISTTRWCLSNSCTNPQKPTHLITPCAQECQRFSFTLRHKEMPVPLYLKGNTIFFNNPKLPQNLEELKITRKVYEPEIPV